MKEFSFAAMIVAACAVLPAAPTACVYGATTRYTVLVDGCTVDGVLFREFAYIPETTNPPGPDAIMIDPVVVGLFQSFELSMAPQAMAFRVSAAPEVVEFRIGFDVVGYLMGARPPTTGMRGTSPSSVITETLVARPNRTRLTDSGGSPGTKTTRIAPSVSTNVLTDILLQTAMTPPRSSRAPRPITEFPSPQQPDW